jgi:hypothetical protein
MRSWQVQEAKARFSEFLEASLKDGPQVVTRRGVETASSRSDRAMASAAARRASDPEGAPARGLGTL